MFVSSAFKSGFSTMLLHLQQVCEQDEWWGCCWELLL
jgi:hypothetical protein